MLLTVDTLAFAVVKTSLEDLMRFLMLDICDFEQGKGFNKNYRSSKYLGGIRIGYDNITTRFSCYVYMSGQGCRTYESYQKNKYGSFDWFSFIKRLNAMNDGIEDELFRILSWRRIDIACDDRSGSFDVRKLARYYEQNKIAGKARTFRYTLGSEESFYAGAPSSDHFIRIYNKLLERGFVAGDADPWIRVEWQLRDNHAAQLINSWISSGDLPGVFCGYTREFLRFLSKPNDGSNSQRIPEAPFWVKFLNDASRISFVSAPGTVYNLRKLDNYVNYQVASSIKTYLLTHDFDYTDFLDHFLRDDIKLNKDQLALIRDSANTYTFDFLTKYGYSVDDESIDSMRLNSPERFYEFKLQLLNSILRGVGDGVR